MLQFPRHDSNESSAYNFCDSSYSREGGLPLLDGFGVYDPLGGGHSASSSRFRRFIPTNSGSSTPRSVAPFISEQYNLPTDPTHWISEDAEDDDYLHNPDSRDSEKSGTIFTARGAANLGCVAVLVSALLMLFAGYPIFVEITNKTRSIRGSGSFNLGGTNASGQVPDMPGVRGLIDPETPIDAYSITSREGPDWELVFSDEFNTDGRSFYAGDDPFWEAIDLHAWSTNDLEWYDPRQVTTQDGKLVLTLDKIEKNGLEFVGASIQSWNKFCFQGGRLEASIRLPGKATSAGLWPAFWTMGNLGRVGYGGTLDGTWPYSYDECDTGTLPNQTNPLTGKPEIAKTSGTDAGFNYELSYLPGQRLSRCTCPNDKTHPGPKHPDGTWVGRSAPEIDVLEAQVANSIGEVSLSAQWAPFDPGYSWNNETYAMIANASTTHLNTYRGGVYQQTTSAVATTNQGCYQFDSEYEPGCYSVYAFEYKTGSDGYIAWFNEDEFAWEYREGGMGPRPEADIGLRQIPTEPMYILFNIAISENFGWIDYAALDTMWPVKMHVDYMRLYQDPARRAIGCDPDDHPTAEYIQHYFHAYNDPNITTWEQMTDDPKPLNSLTSPECPVQDIKFGRL